MSNAPARPGPFLTITGPTAVGKTALSLSVAEAIDAEIISVDSRQVYQELNIGTATPSDDVLARVPHHFINELSITADADFSAGAFATAANKRIREILSRGREPLLVGGSTLYLHALQYGLADIPSVDDAVRARLEERLADEGAEALYAELQAVDPEQAASADPTKTHRVIRALEVYHGTGKPLSYYYANQPEPPFRYVTAVLHRPRPALYDRINARVDAMLDAGLLDEVQAVMDRGARLDEPPLSTIGYREPIQHLRGEMSREEMIRRVKRNTRRYAKRQLTWFRRYDDYHTLDAEEATPAAVLALREEDAASTTNPT
ncbi:tRNA (adenosine(37)-N6)-dimethylallyltransferase MiaA [Salisaeta longa]|uniref:tRNA (adenosine(37)-N6)-dimethylallyltransferase MiaA n=1 Tax=Salisaeta longa TaxID=503170 RepID=UPI0003B75BA2|nr:tRNA (adenosine(37)-N6)-dimethylallyltransferase MiaA [Salisaeta longa]